MDENSVLYKRVCSEHKRQWLKIHWRIKKSHWRGGSHIAIMSQIKNKAIKKYKFQLPELTNNGCFLCVYKKRFGYCPGINYDCRSLVMMCLDGLYYVFTHSSNKQDAIETAMMIACVHTKQYKKN